MSIRALLLLFVSVATIGFTRAQQTERYTHPEADYQEGLELFDKQQYVAAQKVFSRVLENEVDPHSEKRINAEYYMALCALELYHGDAEFQVLDFMERHPQSPRIAELSYTMGAHYFNRRKYRNAGEWLEKLSGHKFKEPQRSQYHFMLGYSYFQLDDLNLAKDHLQQVKKGLGYTSAASTYYYAHILYQEEKFPLALKEFKKIQDDDDFGPFAPYYIAQILYEQEAYDELIALGTGLVDRAEESRKAEINRFIGEGYYQQGKFEDALPYFEAYKALGGKMLDPDLYAIGFIYYKTGAHEQAIAEFNKIIDSRDSLAQSAYFILGDCYLRSDKKQEAMNAFAGAVELDFDHAITEESRFNFAKLSYEVGNPFADPGRELMKFLEDYPESRFYQEASTYLVTAYLNTKDYQRALESLDKLELNSRELRASYQKVAYLRGVQLFNARKYGKADALFKSSLEYPISENYMARAIYWRGECAYRSSLYEDARDLWLDYLSTHGTLDLPESERVNYSLGYAYFKLKDYAPAASRFKEFYEDGVEDGPLRKDALIRAGDCYFATKGYYTAARFYSDARALPGVDGDYALFQLSRCQGLQNKQESRLNSLEELIQKYPDSDLLDDAWYETGNASLDIGKDQKALEAYTEVINGFPNSFYVKRSLLQVGLIHYNRMENELALNQFKILVRDYPNTDEAVQAVQFAEKIYKELDRVDEYAIWIKDVSFVEVSDAELDTLAWDAAYEKYQLGSCVEAIPAFENYLRNNAQGNFAVDAHYYLAECAYNQGDTSTALIHFTEVDKYGLSKYTEKAVLKTSFIQYDKENWSAALNAYQRLLQVAQYPENKRTAKLGLMRTAYKMEDHPSTISYARIVLQLEKLSTAEEEEAHILLARSYWTTKDDIKAYEEYLWLEKYAQGSYKAEAMYHLAQVYYQKGHYEESQIKIFDLLKNLPSYKYWGNRSLVLLAMNYWKLEDYYQAYYTLDQILNNVDDEEVQAWAREVRDEIEQEEALRKQDEAERESLQNRIDTISGPEEMEE
jgi:TolA-binding protein